MLINQDETNTQTHIIMRIHKYTNIKSIVHIFYSYCLKVKLIKGGKGVLKSPTKKRMTFLRGMVMKETQEIM